MTCTHIYFIGIKVMYRGESMSIEIIKDVVKVEEILARDESQTLIEADVYLNTNKQEIESILWVEGRSEISNAKTYKDRLIINGKVKLNIVYKSLDEEEPINTLETVKEFKEELILEGITEEMEAQVKSNIEYIEYELDDNRIDLRAVVNLSTKVGESKEIEIIEEIRGQENLQILEEDIRYKEVLGKESSYANVKETINISENQAAIEKVIRFNIEVNELQTLVTDERMIISAEANVSMIYLGDNQINYIKESLPFNHFIEMPDIYKNSLGEVKLEVAEGIYEIVEDELGELRLLDLDISILVTGKVYDYRVKPLVVDVYSTKGQLNIEKEDINILENIDNISHEEDLNLDLGIDALEIIDIKEDFNILDKRLLGDEIIIDGLLTANVFYMDRDSGHVRNFKDNFPYKSTIYVDGDYEGSSLDVEARLGQVKYEIKKDMLSIDNTISYDIQFNKYKSISGIKSIEETEDLIDLQDRASITIYIVQKGDLLWDIAKRYKTTIEDILSSNNLDSSYEIQVGDKIIIEKTVDIDFE